MEAIAKKRRILTWMTSTTTSLSHPVRHQEQRKILVLLQDWLARSSNLLSSVCIKNAPKKKSKSDVHDASHTRLSQRTHAKEVDSKNIPGFRYLQQSKKPGDTEVTWSLGWRSWRPGSLPFMFSVALAHTQLLVWYDDNTIIVSASIGVPIPQFRGRSCPYRLPLYCDFVLLYQRERERDGAGEKV